MGACGCGSGGSRFPWQAGVAADVYTAAASQALYDPGGDGGRGGRGWCGSGCGACYRLNSTGAAPCAGCGVGGAAGQSITVVVTNLCPSAGNARWCPAMG